MVDVILGMQWGDEGKGKIVDYFAKNYDVIARFQGGPNAGHTLYVDGKKIVLHQIPSGIFHAGKTNLIGNGVVLDAVTLKKECANVAALGIDYKKNLFISERAHLILPTHRALDKASELSKGNEKIGSTLKGIGPAYMDKTGRNGLRVGNLLEKSFTTDYIKLRMKHQRLLDNFNFQEDISLWEEEFFEAVEFLREFKIVNGEYFINEKIQKGQKILAEGAQGSMLDVDFGTFPFVTSSNTISAGVCTGLGIAPQKINEVFGISKAYCTRVGSGPFPTELLDETGEKIRTIGNEFGSTTGRPRRCGWIDLVALRYAVMLSGVTKLIITKADVMDSFDPVKVAVAYKVDGVETQELPYDLCSVQTEPVYKTFPGWEMPIGDCKNYEETPQVFKDYCSFVEQYLGTKVAFVSNGTGRDQLLQIP